MSRIEGMSKIEGKEKKERIAEKPRKRYVKEVEDTQEHIADEKDNQSEKTEEKLGQEKGKKVNPI